ncbi:MAG: hypothetical protein U0411_09745 [Thermodesulfovibrionales bacterium]
MTNEKNYALQENVERKIRNYLVLYACAPLFIAWSDEVLALVADGFGGKGSSDLAHKSLIFAVTAVGTVSAILLNLVRDLCLPLVLDDCLFRVRHTVDRMVEEKLIAYARSLHAAEWREMERSRAGLPSLFRYCTREQAELNDLSARYWEHYYVNISVVCLGAVSFVLSAVLAAFRCRSDLVAASPLGVLAIVLMVGFSTRMTLLGRIYALPVQQIREMRPEEFTGEIGRRWGSPAIGLSGSVARDRMHGAHPVPW